MIQVNNLHKRFGELHVLQGVNMQVKKGEIVAILGRSGAGKTTLLQIIGTLDKPDSGEVIIDNKNVFELNEEALSMFRNEHIGFIFQQHQLLPEFTAVENVMLPGLIARRNEKEVKERALMLLSQLGLEDRVEHKPSELSGGEQQRVAAARAMLMQPSVILADEPSGSLDEQNKQELHKLLLEMREKYGQTIILVTHDQELANICDRQLVIHDGKI